MRSAVPATDAAAYELLEQLRWGGPPSVCPMCGAAGRCFYLHPRGGLRATRTGAPTGRRVWKCGACRRQFSVLSGTVLHGTKIAVRKWVQAAAEWPVDGTSPSATELVERYGISRAAARHMLGRLAAAATAVDTAGQPVGALLGAVLRLPAERAAEVRDRTPPRVRPRPQTGPTADYQ